AFGGEIDRNHFGFYVAKSATTTIHSISSYLDTVSTSAMVWGIFDILQASKKVSDPFKFDISSYLQDKLSD
ncbi:hypothetical protein L914_19804, partial [Phytophthora nicotianae]